MKSLNLLVLFTLVSCADAYVSAEEIAKANNVCENNGGLKTLAHYGNFIRAHCNNGAVFQIPGEQK